MNVLSYGDSILTADTDWKQQFDKIQSDVPEHNIWQDVLSKYVTDHGDVDYLGLIDDDAQLQLYLDYISDHPPHSGWTNNEKLAYWINAYNAFTLRLILDNYPLKSIKNIAGNIPMVNSPWDIEFFKIGGLEFTLNDIEHKVLRKEFQEPRIHFVINCASESCPLLANFAYSSEKLEFQLESQTKAFLMDWTKNIIAENQLRLSPIFKWFSVDFGSNEEIIDFIEKSTDLDINANVKITYKEYDWSLNSI